MHLAWQVSKTAFIHGDLLQVQVPASGSETIECSVCQHPFLVNAHWSVTSLTFLKVNLLYGHVKKRKKKKRIKKKKTYYTVINSSGVLWSFWLRGFLTLMCCPIMCCTVIMIPRKISAVRGLVHSCFNWIFPVGRLYKFQPIEFVYNSICWILLSLPLVFPVIAWRVSWNFFTYCLRPLFDWSD